MEVAREAELSGALKYGEELEKRRGAPDRWRCRSDSERREQSRPAVVRHDASVYLTI